MVLKIYIRVQKGVDIVAMGGKNEPIRYILFAFVVKSCNQEMYFIQQSNNNHYFSNTDIDIAMRWYNPAIYYGNVYYQQSIS